MTSIAIVGPGAVGGIVAAWLSRNAALSVTPCARAAFADLRVETPGGVIVASPRVLVDPAAVDGPVDSGHQGSWPASMRRLRVPPASS